MTVKISRTNIIVRPPRVPSSPHSFTRARPARRTKTSGSVDPARPGPAKGRGAWASSPCAVDDLGVPAACFRGAGARSNVREGSGGGGAWRGRGLDGAQTGRRLFVPLLSEGVFQTLVF